MNLYIFLRILVLVTLPTVFFQESTLAQQTSTRIIAFYNLENFFDTIDTRGVNDSEFLPDSPKQWNSERYRAKIDRMAKVISKLGSSQGVPGPAIIGLCEMENRAVLEDLVKSPLVRHLNYQIIHHDSPDRRGIDMALLYQPQYFKVTNTRSVPLIIHGEEGNRVYTRDQLVVSGILDGEPMHFIVNHWPSRLGGEERSRRLRNEAAQLTRSLVDSIKSTKRRARVIVMGDLNDNPVDESVLLHLNARGSSERLKRWQMYNPGWEPYNQGIGTLVFRDKWNLFDQIIVTRPFLKRNQRRFVYQGFHVFTEPFLLRTEERFKGRPLRTFAGDTYLGGYSDHLPVYIVIRKRVRNSN